MKSYAGFINYNTLIYALNEFKSVLIIDTILIKFQGWLLVKYHYVKYSLFSVRLGYIWLLGIFEQFM